jgi:4-azaleucine resistance transporter AzlC
MQEDVPALERATEPASEPGPSTLEASRRRLLVESLAIAVSAIGFGFVYGLSARQAGFSPLEAMAMSTIVFAGAAQFAAIGYVTAGLAWPAIALLTFLLNARHLLYSAALGPWLSDVPRPRRAVMAHLLTDEAFAVSLAHFRRLGRADEIGYWIGAVGSTFIPWNLATLAGVYAGGSIPEPGRFGVDIIFPAAMIGLAAGLITGRRELVAAFAGAAIAVSWALFASPAFGVEPSTGVIVGGVVGPLVGLLIPASLAAERAPLGTPASAERFSMPGTRLDDDAEGLP